MQRRPVFFMEDELQCKIKRLVAIEVRSRMLVNALLRQRYGCLRKSTGDADVEKAINDLLELFDLRNNYWKR